MIPNGLILGIITQRRTLKEQSPPVRAASLLRSCASTPSSPFGQLLGALDPNDLETITAVLEKQPLYDSPAFPGISTFPRFRYRCVIYAPFTWSHQKGSTWHLSLPSEPVGALPKIKGPFAPNIGLAISLLRRDLEVKMERLLGDKLLAVRTGWVLAPLREKVGQVPGDEREVRGSVWWGTNVWATTAQLEDGDADKEGASVGSVL